MSLRYRQGIFATDDKNHLSSEQVKSAHKQDTLLGSAKPKDGWTSSSSTMASCGWASPRGQHANRSLLGLEPGGARAGNLQILPKRTLPHLLPLSLRKPIDMSTQPVCHLRPTLYFLFHADSSFDKTTEYHLYFQSQDWPTERTLRII